MITVNWFMSFYTFSAKHNINNLLDQFTDYRYFNRKIEVLKTFTVYTDKMPVRSFDSMAEKYFTKKTKCKIKNAHLKI